MRALRLAFHAVAIAVLGAGWYFFYSQSSAAGLAAVDAARSTLNAMRAIDMRWNDQLVAARASGARFEPAPHARAYAVLEVQALRVSYPGVGLALVGVRNAFEEKAVALRLAARGEKVFDEVWLAPTGPRMDAMSRVLDRAFDDALTWAELYRSWLLLYSLFLVTVAGYSMYRLSGSAAR